MLGARGKFTIFKENGDLLSIPPEFFEPKWGNKICVRNLLLAHFIKDSQGIEEDVKVQLLNKLDLMYKSGKAMHNKLILYRYQEKAAKEAK